MGLWSIAMVYSSPIENPWSSARSLHDKLGEFGEKHRYAMPCWGMILYIADEDVEDRDKRFWKMELLEMGFMHTKGHWTSK